MSSTYDDLLGVPDDGYLYELVRGEIRRLPPTKGNQGRLEWILGAAIDRYLEDRAQALGLSQDAHIDERDLLVGRCICGAAGIHYCLPDDPDQVREADVVYLSPEQIARGVYAVEGGHVSEMPALVAEVVDTAEPAAALHERVNDYLAGGAQVVWLVQRHERSVRIFQPGAEPHAIGECYALEAESLLPGFSLPLQRLFNLGR
jgi:Uma2 family endonuclease